MSFSDGKDLSNQELRRLVEQLIGEVARLRERVAELEEENRALKDEVARLKSHKGRPKLKPSGMEKNTDRQKRRQSGKKGSRASRQKPVVNEVQKLKVSPSAGARFKGYEDFLVQDLKLEARIIRYRRERWVSADGETLVAPLPAGLCGHFGPELVRFVLLQHHQGQVTVDRITTFLKGIGLVISKRQVLRFLSGDITAFSDEANAVLRAGLTSASWITVDDTSARHRAKNGVTTQIGHDHFTFFATTFSKSRKNFLERLRAGYQDYVINAPALDDMRKHALAGLVIAKLEAHKSKVFADQAAWSAHLDQLGILLGMHPNPVKIATEGALFGSLHAHGLLQGTVVVSDGAGQFRLADHALCWVHAERFGRLARAALTVLHSLHKLIGHNDDQRRAIDITRQLIWWFYADLKAYQRNPKRQRANQLRARFDRIFTRKTGFVTLDRLLARLHARKDELLRVLDRPEIPLHTNGSENDIRCQVTKRKISGGTWSENGREARDVFLGLMKTCQKLGISFFDYLGSRLNVPSSSDIIPLPELVHAANS